MDGHFTVDGFPVTDGLVVWDYDMDLSRVSFAHTSGMDSPWGFDGWFGLLRVSDGARKLMNGERMVTRHPRTRQLAADAAERAGAASTRCLRCHVVIDTTAWLPVIVFVREPGSIDLRPTNERLCVPHGSNGANGMDRATYDTMLAALRSAVSDERVE